VICRIDNDNADLYKKRTTQFIARLDSLHIELANKLKVIQHKPIFTAHNAFKYFIDEFDLTFGGAIEESPGKEISPKHFAAIIDKINNANVNCIFSEPQLNTNLINSIAKQTKIKIVILDPLNSNKKNNTYYNFVRYNSDNILKGLK
jgi:zinc transport system substrate-binding protein